MKKTPEDIIIFHKCAKNHDHIMLYCSVTNVIVIFQFGLFFDLLPPQQPKKSKFLKKIKKHLEISSFTKNYDQMMYGSWDMVCDRWTNGKSDIQSWVSHLKISSIHPIDSWDKADFRVAWPKRPHPYLTIPT